MTKKSTSGIFSGAAAVAALAFLIPACGGGGGGGAAGPAFRILAFVHGAGGATVSRTAVTYVRLSQAADPATVTGANVSLTDAGGGNVASNVTYIACVNLIQIEPQAPLAGNAVFTVQVTAGVTTPGGTALPADQSSFTTNNDGDVTRPTFGGLATADPTPVVQPPWCDAITSDSIDLTWPAATDASAVTYDIFVSTTSGCFDFSAPPAQSTAALLATVQNLSSNTTYFFVVRVRDASGNVDSGVVTGAFTQLQAKTGISFAVDIHASILAVHCIDCHRPGGIGPFSMVGAATAYGNLVGAAPFCGPLPANYQYRVEPCSPANSFLVSKVSSTPACGSRMPLSGPPFLSAGQEQIITDWINEGAGDN